MKAYRYNSKSRNDRKFNTCGMEKNPNNLKFYASNLKYVENYKYVYMDCGEVLYECDLEIIEVDVEGLFDMNANFESLDTYKKHIDDVIGVMMRDYTHCLNNATKASDKKLFQGFIN